ncbi:MAG: enoyl-CoA hydratase/isomerase family protein [Phenylobacterium sp.]|uniref:enoyl-CoA hydratase-related protein n=1 Tax=Phenylobacterium sp. TaxID=1871053 RepID=UPI001B591107|nr:enoyl-CoA hydratase-related protein [Phenylobacterium sp.]MBP7815000.1 enoyl-CoA hydratase/isomerase family protein [Phenylobacterium sp.]MBP9231296.1 enoyl-CoA hydratase/isomerase family protein [Phenylobacterium sp.]MBP9754232.1 enoyl-CoA hydratase/isomerase family protein [Phenylobacterium sp.]
MTNPIADPLVEVPDTDVDQSLVRIEATVEGVAMVTINRPERRNAFDARLIAALNEAFETLQGAEGVRVVFLRGAGGIFSAGADLDWMREAADRTESDNREDAYAMARMLKSLWDLPALTVALVEGGAYGGGAGLAATCDIAVATADAKFSFSEVRLGLIAATISPYVVGAVGPRTARALFATGSVFDAAYAEKVGLITEVVADTAALDGACARIAGEMMACAPIAVADSKKLVEDVAYRPIADMMEETAKRIARTRVSPEGQEGVRAFLDKRKPSWVV